MADAAGFSLISFGSHLSRHFASLIGEPTAVNESVAEGQAARLGYCGTGPVMLAVR